MVGRKTNKQTKHLDQELNVMKASRYHATEQLILSENDESYGRVQSLRRPQ